MNESTFDRLFAFCRWDCKRETGQGACLVCFEKIDLNLKKEGND